MSCPEPGQGPASRLDGFHGGGFALHQPAGTGFRAGLDAMLLAASVSTGARGAAVDVGAGTGAVGFGAAHRAPGLSLVLVENEPGLVALLERSRGEPVNSHLASRVRIARADILSGRAARITAGLPDVAFDLVLTNPPFFPASYRASADPLRRAALSVPDAQFLTRWLRACAALVRHGGQLVAILRPEDLPMAATALDGRAGGLAVLPVHTRPGPARRILVRATTGSRAGLSILPALDLTPAGDPGGRLAKAISDGSHGLDLG